MAERERESHENGKGEEPVGGASVSDGVGGGARHDGRGEAELGVEEGRHGEVGRERGVLGLEHRVQLLRFHHTRVHLQHGMEDCGFMNYRINNTHKTTKRKIAKAQ